jgi:multiple sugar transport system ATP-binding protein
MTSATISFESAAKTYPDGTDAVCALDLEIHPGEFIVFVGPSGCGKSTALRMLAGLEDVTRGAIRIDGRIVNDLPPKARDVAMVFQNYALYPHMTVYENMAFGLRLRKEGKEEIRRRVREAARILDLESLLERRPGALSGGQRQRVAMGRALVRKPKAFLMDEPLSNLDAKLRVQMRAEIAQLQREVGATTIYVTHDQVEAMTMGDRVAVIRAGRLQQVDRPETLYARPANVFVAGFIGSPSMNFVCGRLDQDGDDLIVDLAGSKIRLKKTELRNRPALGEFAGRKVIVGLRPEAFAEANGQSRPGYTQLRAQVDIHEALGADVLLHFPIDAAPVLAGEVHPEGEPEHVAERVRFVARVAPDTRARPGDTVTLEFASTALQFFDPTTHVAL